MKKSSFRLIQFKLHEKPLANFFKEKNIYHHTAFSHALNVQYLYLEFNDTLVPHSKKTHFIFYRFYHEKELRS